MITSETEAGAEFAARARFGRPQSAFHRLLVSRRLSAVALVVLALAGVAVGVVLAAVVDRIQRRSSEAVCDLRAQLIANLVNDTATFLSAVDAMVDFRHCATGGGNVSSWWSGLLADRKIPRALKCVDVAVGVRNVSYPVVHSSCAGRRLGLDLSLPPVRDRVSFRGPSDTARIDTIVVQGSARLVGHLDLDAVLDLVDITVHDQSGRKLYSRTTELRTSLAASLTVTMAGQTWSAVCWTMVGGATVPDLVGGAVAALFCLLAMLLSCGMRQARDLLQQSRAGPNQQLCGRTGSLIDFLCQRFLRTTTQAYRDLNAVLNQDEVVPQFAPEHRHGLIKAEHQVQVLRAMCIQLVDLCALEAGTAALLRPAPFDAAALFQTVESEFRVRAEARGVRLDVRHQKLLPAVLIADRRRLEQILFNALSNAVTATPSGGLVTLEVQVGAVLDARASTQRLLLMVSVTDSGPPIPDAVLDAVRSPETDLVFCPDYGGLGLVTIKKLCALMGGRVSLSANPNRLAICVQVQFEQRRGPLASASSADLPLSRTGSRPSPRQAGLLYIGSEPGSVVLVQEMADDVPEMPLTVTRDGAEARRLLGVPDRVNLAARFALIVMDGCSPDTTATDTIRLIRAAGLTIPIVVLGGNCSEKSALLSAGADAVLCKPFTRQQLLGVVTSLGPFGVKPVTDRTVDVRPIPALTIAGAQFSTRRDNPRMAPCARPESGRDIR